MDDPRGLVADSSNKKGLSTFAKRRKKGDLSGGLFCSSMKKRVTFIFILERKKKGKDLLRMDCTARFHGRRKKGRGKRFPRFKEGRGGDPIPI